MGFEFTICNAQLILSACIYRETEGPLSRAFFAASTVHIRATQFFRRFAALKWFEDSHKRPVSFFFVVVKKIHQHESNVLFPVVFGTINLLMPIVALGIKSLLHQIQPKIASIFLRCLLMH